MVADGEAPWLQKLVAAHTLHPVTTAHELAVAPREFCLRGAAFETARAAVKEEFDSRAEAEGKIATSKSYQGQ